MRFEATSTCFLNAQKQTQKGSAAILTVACAILSLAVAALAQDTVTVSFIDTQSVVSAQWNVQFNATATSSGRNSIVGWVWDFGDGTYCGGSTCGSDPAMPQHTYQAAGTYYPVVAAVDSRGTAGEASGVLTLSLADNRYCPQTGTWTGGASDGPALLPQNCFNTGIANTPSPGSVIPVPIGGSLQTAYNGASCGQTLQLAHGGQWTLPIAFAAKNCSDSEWVTITSDGVLPPEGVRIAPSYLGQMAQLIEAPNGKPATFGDHIRFIGIAWLKGPGKIVYSLASLTGGNRVIFDRNYCHGNAGEDLSRCFGMSNANYVAVVDSYGDEIHCIAKTGSCVDSQFADFGLDTTQSGPYKLVNNHFEAAGEGIISGGGAATAVPCDFEVRRNELVKPLSWNPADPSFGGITYVVKNHFEFKTGCRALLEGNIFSNNWGGFSQDGSMLLIGPKSQSNQCAACATHDITVRYNYWTTGAAAYQIGTAPSGSGGWASQAYGYSIHDNVWDNMQYAACYGCGNNTSLIGSSYLLANPPPSALILHDVLVNHNTLVTNAFPRTGTKGEAAFMLMSGPPPDNPSATPQIANVFVENNIFPAGNSGFYPTGGGKTQNCSVAASPLTLANMVSNCWSGTSGFTNNLYVGWPLNPGIKGPWPPVNLSAADWGEVGFTNYNNGAGGNYVLTPDSPGHAAATDGTDVGADTSLVNQYIAGVAGVLPVRTQVPRFPRGYQLLHRPFVTVGADSIAKTE